MVKQKPLIVGELPERPWQIIHMDICGPFPSGEYLFTMIDSYSKFPEIVILRCIKAGTLIMHMKGFLQDLDILKR